MILRRLSVTAEPSRLATSDAIGPAHPRARKEMGVTLSRGALPCRRHLAAMSLGS